MRLLINTSIQRFGGGVQVAASFINECKAFIEHEYHVVLGSAIGTVLDTSEFPGNFTFYGKSFGVMGLRKVTRVQRAMTELERQINPDCIVTTTGPAYWRSDAPHLMGFNLPLYIYSESPFIQSLSPYRRARLAARKRLHSHFFRRDADALIVQTDDVNQRVRSLLRTDNVHTVTNTHNGWYDDPAMHPLRLPERKPHSFRLLTVSSYYAHKNLELIPRVIEALPEELRRRVEFVLTLTEKQYREHIAPEIPDQVRLVGPVPPPECPSLYMECDAMFLPTLAECSSASYPEAMKMEKPIITTDLGFARSICQDAALYFLPCDAESAAQQIARLIDDQNLKASLQESGRRRLAAFDSPAQRAEKILSICESLCAPDKKKPAMNRLFP